MAVGFSVIKHNIVHDTALQTTLRIFLGVVTTNLALRYFLSESTSNPPNDACHWLINGWESCITEQNNSIILNLLNSVDSLISFAMMAVPAMTECIAVRAYSFFIKNSFDTNDLAHVNSSMIAFGAARHIKNYITNSCLTEKDGSCVLNFGSMLDIKAISDRPLAAQKFSSSMGSSPSIGFPSGHTFTLCYRGLSHLAIITEAEMADRKGHNLHYIGFFLSLYGSFTRYTLQWHTFQQVIITLGISFLFANIHNQAKKILNNKGISFNKMAILENYLSFILVVSSFGSISPSKIIGKALNAELLHPQVFYTSLLVFSILIDCALITKSRFAIINGRDQKQEARAAQRAR